MLFGSGARNRLRRDSDVDIAVYCEGPAQDTPFFERRPGAFREFQSLASRRYCDTAKLRQAQHRAIELFLKREGLA